MAKLETRLAESEGRLEVARDLFKRALLAKTSGWSRAELETWYTAIFEWVKDCEEMKWTLN